jgi:hypothetical protein
MTENNDPGNQEPVTATPGAGAPAPGAAPAAGSDPIDWRAGLPDDIKSDPSLAPFKDLTGLAKSYVHTKKMVNEKGLIPPKPDSPPEMWEQFYNALGRPESPEKYDLGDVKLPEGLEIDADMEKQFREQAHKAGLTSQQAKALREWYFSDTVNKIQGFESNRKAEREQAERDLRDEWGPEYDHKIQSAAKAWKMFADPAELPKLTELFDSGLGNNPLIVRLFSRVAAAMGEDPKLHGENVTNSSTYADQARDILTSEAYTDAKHPQHKDVVARAAKLFQLAYPEKGTT